MLSRRSLLSVAAASVVAPAVAQSTREKTLKFVPQAGLSSLDPIWTTAAVVQNHGFYVFDTLYGLDAKFNVVPQMAAGHGVSDDKLTWTVTLRDGLTFHDGAPVRAIDCIASLKRWAARDVLGQLLAAAVNEWIARDDKTLVIRLKQPFPLMLFALAKPATNVPFIMPERLAMTDPLKQITEMVGSGPYRFLTEDFVSGTRAAYAKFAGYRPAPGSPERTSGAKIAHFERIEWTAMPDSATALAALQTGEIDWWEQVLADTVPLLKRNRNIVVGDGDPNGYIGVVRFNSAQAPFNNAKLREAVLRAVNQADYLGAITNNDPTAYQTCHTTIPCGTPYSVTPASSGMSEAPDLARARELVKASGYDGEKIVILNPADFPTIRPMGQITHDTLSKLGLNSELLETDWGTVLQRRGSREPADKGGWSIFHTWFQAVGNTLPPMLSYTRGQGAAGWFGWYESKTAEALNQQWLAATTEEERLKLAGDIQNVAAQEAPVVPLGLFKIRTAYRNTLTGMVEGVSPFPWGVRRV